MLRQVVGKLGRAGGHDRRAGGTIPLPSTSATAVEQMQSELRRRLLEALHIDECRGHRLVSRRRYSRTYRDDSANPLVVARSPSWWHGLLTVPLVIARSPDRACPRYGTVS